MKNLSILLLSLFFLSPSLGSKEKGRRLENAIHTPEQYSKVSNNTQSEATVLICTGKYSKRYHNSMCRGMKSCKGERKKASLSDAKKMGLTACGYCY